MTTRQAIGLSAVGALTWASAAFGHGIGSRGDLPIPKNFFLVAAMLAVVVSFFVAAVMWQEPRLATMSEGHPLGRWTARLAAVAVPIGRTLGLLAFVVVVIAAWGGPTNPSDNIAPVAVYVVFWIILLWVCALVGNVWRALNPWDTIAMYASGRMGPAPAPKPDDGRFVTSHWPAAAGLVAFQWLELAHPDPSNPRVLAVAITAYSLIVFAAAARWGRAWIQTGEGFTVLFGLAAAIAPFGRDSSGCRVVRRPFSGLAAVPERRGLAAVVLSVIGGTTFDGISRSRWFVDTFGDVQGWERSAINTAGLVGAIAAVSILYLAGIWLVAHIGRGDVRRTAVRFAASLVPIAVAYSVAHYFSLAVFEGQSAWRLLSDPYGQGWNLFGTADHQIDYRVMGATTIALVQTIAIVIGHMAGVILAHDRALQDFGPKRATASQIPMLAVMVALTLTGLTLLLSA
jgi:hypothetical protein